MEIQNQKDHDLLIELNVKVQQVLTELKEWRATSDNRVAKVETRVDAIEKTLDQVSIQQMQSVGLANAQWIRDFDTRWRTVIAMASFIGGIIGFLVSVLTKLSGIIT